MAIDVKIEIRETRDFDYVASLLNSQKVSDENQEKFRIFEVWKDDIRAGFFLLVIVSGFDPQHHTQLEIRGVDALLAFKKYCKILKREGCERISTYAPAGNRRINLAARLGGFKQYRIDPDGTLIFSLKL